MSVGWIPFMRYKVQDTRVQEAISGQNPHYQHVFFSISEKDTEHSIRTNLTRLYEHGIRSMVLMYERTDGSLFKTTKFDDDWWERLGYVSKICEELGMTYWIQDAAPFPTGSANGWFEEKEHKYKSKKFIAERHTDVKGPIQNMMISVDQLTNSIQGNVLQAFKSLSEIPNRFLCAVAMKKTEDGLGYDSESALDLTSQVKDGVLRADLGTGNWRIFIILETYSGGRKHFMNLLDEKSVRVQIDSVHVPHYEHLRSQLGKTWMGFFYDEPEVGNLEGYVFDCLPGKTHNGMSIPLPWSKDVLPMLEKRLGKEFRKLLPCLWYDCGKMTPVVRHAYMDVITELIAKNYNGQVYQWCESRGIQYIGHVLEDENSHARLGCGAGHFFRVEEGQHMAGIDVIGGQVWPGLDFKGMSWYGAIDGDGEFYHYGLAKLGSSAGHIDPKKQGRSICEFLAVYGNISGTRIRKFVIDHLLVNGINNLIPADPGLYNHPVFSRKLNAYANRMCHILNGGVHVAPVAILYHADAEWSGTFQYFHKPGKVLATNQIDYDVIPKDVFLHRDYYHTRVEAGKLKINKEEYRALVIPYSERIPKAIVSFIDEAQKAGFPIYFVDEHPEGYCENTEKLPPHVYACRAVPLNRLAETLRKDGIFDISISNHQHYLRYLHYRRGDIDIYMFHNEEPEKAIETVVSIPSVKPVRVYDVMENCLYVPEVMVRNGKTEIVLRLGQYESMVFLFGEDGEALPMPRLHEGKELQATWEISFESLDSFPSPASFTAEKLVDIGAPGKFQHFYGKITYSTTFTAEEKLPQMLDLGRVSECAEVYLNGEYLGAAVAAPYCFRLGNSVKKGINELKIVVTNNMSRSADAKLKGGNSVFASFEASTYVSAEPSGLLGPVRLI